MRQLYLVCIKHKHVKSVSEKHPALSLCFKLGIYIYFSLLSIWTLLKTSGQASLKNEKNTVELPSTVWHHVSAVSHYRAEFQMLKSYPPQPSLLSSSPPPPQSHLDGVPLFLQLNHSARHTKLLTWQGENTSYD